MCLPLTCKIPTNNYAFSRLLTNAAIHPSIHPSVCLSVCSMPIAQQQCIIGRCLLQNTNRKPHAGNEIRWPALSAAENSNKAITSNASKVFGKPVVAP